MKNSLLQHEEIRAEEVLDRVEDGRPRLASTTSSFHRGACAPDGGIATRGDR